jgi:Flp pilus assembly pilin Flp
VEYALVAAVLAFAVIAAEASMAARITGEFNMIGNSL